MDPLYILAIVLGVIVIGYALIAVVGSLSILSLAKAELEPLDEPDEAVLSAKVEQLVDSQWIADESFEWVGGYVMHLPIGTPKIAAWKQRDSPTFLCVYFMDTGQTNTDIVSIFAEDVGLTTGTSKDGHLIPLRPGSWMQTFDGVSIAELWLRHVEAEPLVADGSGITPRDTYLPFEEIFLDAIRKQAAYARSIPLWPLRIPFWYLLRRHRLKEKTVAEQMGTS